MNDYDIYLMAVSIDKKKNIMKDFKDSSDCKIDILSEKVITEQEHKLLSKEWQYAMIALDELQIPRHDLLRGDQYSIVERIHLLDVNNYSAKTINSLNKEFIKISDSAAELENELINIKSKLAETFRVAKITGNELRALWDKQRKII